MSRNPSARGRYSSEARSTLRAWPSVRVREKRTAARRKNRAEATAPAAVSQPPKPSHTGHSATGMSAIQVATITVAVHPGDGEEVRNLPHEDDEEERDATFGRLPAAGGTPADQRRQRPRHGPD